MSEYGKYMYYHTTFPPSGKYFFVTKITSRPAAIVFSSFFDSFDFALKFICILCYTRYDSYGFGFRPSI